MSPRGSAEQDADTAALLRFLISAEEAQLLQIAYGMSTLAPNDARQHYLREKVSLMRAYGGYGRIAWWLTLDAGNRAAVREAALKP